MTRLKCLITAAAVTIAMAQGASAQSVYGCEGLDGFHSLPSIEGTEGVFYRINPDLRNFHPFSDHVADQIARLSQALAQGGTKLVYAPMPPKSMVMTDQLPQLAYDYGFEPALAATVYDDMITRLRQRGVAVADLRKALVSGSRGKKPYFQTDYRLNALGAKLAAQAIAEAANGGGGVAALAAPFPAAAPAAIPARQPAAVPAPTPAPAPAPAASYRQLVTQARPTLRVEAPAPQPPQPVAAPGAEPEPAPVPVAGTEIESDMRNRLQQHCMIELPRVVVEGVAPPAPGAPGQPAGRGAIVVAGTEYTGTPEIGFASFLGQALRGQVQMVSTTGAGPFGSITSYLTSPAFEQSRPRILVWENPVYYNIASFGDQPMRELIAAASGSCRTALQMQPGAEPNTLRAMLSGIDQAARPMLYLDAGSSEVTEARFTFHSPLGYARTRTIARPEGATPTGRFYVPMSGLWPEGAQFVDIQLDAAFGGTPRLAACFN